jgi:hypothetical protein
MTARTAPVHSFVWEYGCCSRAKHRLAVVFVSEIPPELRPVLLDRFDTEYVFG